LVVTLLSKVTVAALPGSRVVDILRLLQVMVKTILQGTRSITRTSINSSSMLEDLGKSSLQ